MPPSPPGRPTLVAAAAVSLLSVATLLAAPHSAAKSTLRPREAISLAVADQLGGNLGAVAVVGDVVFAGVGPRVVALSSAGASWRLLGRSELLDGVVLGLAAQGGRVV